MLCAQRRNSISAIKCVFYFLAVRNGSAVFLENEAKKDSASISAAKIVGFPVSRKNYFCG